MRADEVPGEWWDAAAEAMNWTPGKCTRAELRAIIAALAPLIAEAEREKIAAEMDCACEGRAAVLAAGDTNSASRWNACGRDACSALEAAAIRARKDAP